MTPDEWLASFESKIADMQRKAAEFKENLEASSATESSADGSLRVTVAPNGSLTDLSISDDAMRRSGGELAAQIMKLARKAQRQAAVRVAEAFVPLGGEDSEALRLATGFLPPPEDDDEPPPPDDDGYAFTQAPEDEEQTRRPPEPPRRSGQPPQARGDDDEDFDSDQIFGRRDEW